MRKIAIIGLGYVGLPLSLEFSKKNFVIGYDNNKKRISSLQKRTDSNEDLQKNEKEILKKSKNLYFTDNHKKLSDCEVFIITVPTPVKKNKNPDLTYLINATKIVSKYLKKKDLVIYESTVFPGATEEICKPILERGSKLKLNNDFYIGYSPERLSPGDLKHGLRKIIKITSGSNNKAAKIVDNLYKSIIPKGTFLTKSIKVAEAAKVIENIQRDINIALMNEIYIFCDKLKINFENVHKLASTKWNFTNYSPGLVGGHCLPVDPYYFSHIAEQNKIQTRVTLAGRSINEYMRKFLIKKIKNFLKDKKINYKKDIIIFAGLTYKKNVSDMRNSQSFKIFDYFRKFNRNTLGLDPFLEKNLKEKIIKYKDSKKLEASKCIILLVEHKKLNFLFKKSNLKKKLYNVFKINQGKTYQ